MFPETKICSGEKMTTIGIPLGQDGWWNYCTWPDGSHAHILTYPELAQVWEEEHREEFAELSRVLCQRMQETLDELFREIQ
jgi:hypothetical protein